MAASAKADTRAPDGAITNRGLTDLKFTDYNKVVSQHPDSHSAGIEFFSDYTLYHGVDNAVRQDTSVEVNTMKMYLTTNSNHADKENPSTSTVGGEFVLLNGRLILPNDHLTLVDGSSALMFERPALAGVGKGVACTAKWTMELKMDATYATESRAAKRAKHKRIHSEAIVVEDSSIVTRDGAKKSKTAQANQGLADAGPSS